ncbi:MAG TPA: hypothetical protein VGA31_14895 [Thermoanaerobaculia bacterium]
MKKHSLLLPAAGLLALFLGSVPIQAVPVYVRIRPPRIRVERRPVAPSPRHVWVRGYYTWDGAQYVWVPGRWELGPRPHARWVSGHWRHTRHGWYWVEGHWR